MYDVAIIGSGPAGYKCALMCAEAGMKTVVVDEHNAAGGTCLRVGCIPSKAMLHASHKYHELIAGDLEKFGVKVSSPCFDLEKCIKAREENIKTLSEGIAFLLKQSGIDRIIGSAYVEQDKDLLSVKYKSGDKSNTITAKKVVLATGSSHMDIPGITVNEKNIMSSTGCLNLKKIPESMVIAGAGAIGLEMASIWSRLGTKVTVVELASAVAATYDKDISKQLQTLLEKQGISFVLNSIITSVDESDKSVSVSVKTKDSEEITQLHAEKLLIAIGRRPNSGGAMHEVKKDSRGFLEVNDNYETSMPNVFAIGDVIGGPMLAHKAEMEAITVSEIMSCKKVCKLNYDNMPKIIYTSPPVAAIGKTEAYLNEHNIAYNTGKAKFSANGRAKVSFCTDGFAKILSHKKYDTILGVQIIGESADVMINEVSVLMAYGASCEDVFRICHSHPDLNETLRDAAHASFLKK